MKKLLKKLMIVFVCLLVLTTSVFAIDNSSTRSSAYIWGTDASIDAGSNGKITIYFSVTSPDIMTQIGATTIYLYENNGSTEKLVKTFRSSSLEYSNMMNQNTSFHGDNVTYYNGIAGYEYRAEVYLKAANNSGSDTIMEPTGTIRAKK